MNGKEPVKDTPLPELLDPQKPSPPQKPPIKEETPEWMLGDTKKRSTPRPDLITTITALVIAMAITVLLVIGVAPVLIPFLLLIVGIAIPRKTPFYRTIAFTTVSVAIFLLLLILAYTLTSLGAALYTKWMMNGDDPLSPTLPDVNPTRNNPLDINAGNVLLIGDNVKNLSFGVHRDLATPSFNTPSTLVLVPLDAKDPGAAKNRDPNEAGICTGIGQNATYTITPTRFSPPPGATRFVDTVEISAIGANGMYTCYIAARDLESEEIIAYDTFILDIRIRP